MIPEANSISLPIIDGLLISITMFVLAFVGQVAVLSRFDPQILLGDENEYWRKALGKTSNCVWVRVPLGAVVIWIALRISKMRAIRVSRLIMSLVSAITIGLATWYAYRLAGLEAGLTAGFLILISVERAILAIHLWPDILLGLWLLLFSEVLRGASSLSDMALLGLIAALGFLTRVDFTILAVLGGVIVLSHAGTSLPAVGLVIGPTLIAIAALTVFNGKTHGIWAPDTTFQFNVAVSNTEAMHPSAATDELMRKTSMEFKNNSFPQVPTHAHDPRGWVTRAALAFRRTITLLGMETFVRHNLIDAASTPYPQVLKGWLKQPILINLQLWFSALCVAFVLLANGISNGICIIVIAVALTQSMVQTRSRYRMSLLPVLAVNIAAATWNGGVDHLSLNSAITAFFMAGLLIYIRPRAEISIGAHSRLTGD